MNNNIRSLFSLITAVTAVAALAAGMLLAVSAPAPSDADYGRAQVAIASGDEA